MPSSSRRRRDRRRRQAGDRHRRARRVRDPGDHRCLPALLGAERAAGQGRRRRDRGSARRARHRPDPSRGRARRTWVLLDYLDLVVHVQHEEERELLRPASGSGRTARPSPLPASVTAAAGGVNASGPGRAVAARPDRLERRVAVPGQQRHRAGRGRASRRRTGPAGELAQLNPARGRRQRPGAGGRHRPRPGGAVGAAGAHRPGAARDVRRHLAGPDPRARSAPATRRRSGAGWRAATYAPAAGSRAPRWASGSRPRSSGTPRLVAPAATLVVVTHGGATRAGLGPAAGAAGAALGRARRAVELRLVGAGALRAGVRSALAAASSTTPVRCPRRSSATRPDRGFPTAGVQPLCCARSPRRRAVRGCGAAGSAPAWHAGGQGFESPQLHPSPQVSALIEDLEVARKII